MQRNNFWFWIFSKLQSSKLKRDPVVQLHCKIHFFGVFISAQAEISKVHCFAIHLTSNDITSMEFNSQVVGLRKPQISIWLKISELDLLHVYSLWTKTFSWCIYHNEMMSSLWMLWLYLVAVSCGKWSHLLQVLWNTCTVVMVGNARKFIRLHKRITWMMCVL